MDSGKSNGETVIRMPESKSSKGKATITATTKAIPLQQQGVGGRGGRGFAILDFILRLCALITTIAAAATMATTDQSLPFFNQFFQFEASYDDLPTFSYFVVANAISSGYLVLSMPFSIICIVRPQVVGARILLLILDTVMVAFTIAAAAASASIVYLAHTGNSTANWFAICQQYTDFCSRASGAVVASFIAAVIFIFLVILSGISLTRHKHN